MQAKDRQAWMEKNARLNADSTLRIGDAVVDPWGHTGIVVRIELPDGPGDDDDHGTVYVWQDARTGYGLDNCEHHPFTNWKRLLRKRTTPQPTNDQGA